MLYRASQPRWVLTNAIQVAWNLVNDSLRTTCCLRYKPKMIAIAAIYLASKMINQSIQLETVPNLKVLLLLRSPAQSRAGIDTRHCTRFRNWKR